MDLLDRARAYVSKCPPAVSGQSGHAAAFTVATALVHGFGLSEGDAFTLFAEYNRACQPPWSDAELQHKLKSAADTPHDKPRGHLVGSARPMRTEQRSEPKPKLVAPAFPMADTLELPTALPDAARALLLACFRAGEGVRIVPAVLAEDGSEIPEGAGPTLSRDEWLRKLDAHDGDPNGIWKSKAKTGIYVGLNPLRIGCNRDGDVTDYRHALVEFDGLSVEEQWNIYSQSNLPCSAVIFSGGKSLHAWVRVDAQDKAEYDRRVRTLYDFFSPYGLDGKNKNPSRLSRLPGCVRFSKRQELWALGIGATSFSQWLADREVASIGEQFSIDELVTFRSSEDPDCLLGKRWLCRGSSCLIVGQSGVGKSSLMLQAAVTWAFGRALFGVQPVAELRSLIIQHENDKGDVSEMLQGVMQGMGIEATPENVTFIRERVIIVREVSHTGTAFLGVLQRLIEKHRPDLVWVDPLYTYVGDDISSQKVCAEFLIDGLGPITKSTRVCWMFMHHPAKPSTDPKSRKNWNSTDYSYFGFGSSILTNWIRATMTLLKLNEDAFMLMFGKRGGRARALDLKAAPTTRVYVKHSDKGICWEQTDEPENVKDKPKRAAGRPRSDFDLEAYVKGISAEHLTVKQLYARAIEFADVGRTKFYHDILPLLKERLHFDSEHETYSTSKPEGLL
jgi:RecA-family ATPase